MQKTIKRFLNDICMTIMSNAVDEWGLYDGKCGICVFLAEYYKYTNDENVKALLNCFIDKVLNEFKDNVENYTYSTGIAGFMATTDYINSLYPDSVDIGRYKAKLQKYVGVNTLKSLSQGDFDFMSGALGPILYTGNEEMNVAAIEYLNNSKIISSDGYCWCNAINECDLGLSHGMASIIVYLSQRNQYDKYCLLEKAVQYVIASKNKENSGSLYPMHSIIGNNNVRQKSRLAWCYGDLGIIIALEQANEILKDSKLSNIIRESIEYEAHRLALKDNGVLNMYFCHGSSGIAQTFLHLHKKSKVQICYKAYEYWIMQTVEFIKDGCYDKTNLALLDGIIGSALVLLGFISQGENKWEKLLMMF